MSAKITIFFRMRNDLQAEKQECAPCDSVNQRHTLACKFCQPPYSASGAISL